MRIAFLGTGQMGSAIVRKLHAAGHTVCAWNRTPAKAQALAEEGITVTASIDEALQDAEAVFTMLTDDKAIEEVLLKKAGVLEQIPPGGIHVSLSTLSVAMSQRLTAEHEKRWQKFLAAPVFGRPAVAEAGRLWIAIAGDPDTIEKVQPVLAAASRGITVIDTVPWKAHALKLGGNFLITAMIQSLSEAFVFSSSQGIEPAIFLETVNQALFQSPFYENYGKVMLHPPEQPGATVEIGFKDTRLFQQAAQATNLQLPLANYFLEQFQKAVQAGLKDADWAAAQYRVVRDSQTTQ